MRLLADLMLVVSATSVRSCSESELMMARVRPSGRFELLSAAAWGRALGYPPEELSGKSLRELMRHEESVAGRLLAGLLDDQDAKPVDVTLCCKDAQRKFFRFHRRFDWYSDTIYILADELPEGRHP